VISRPRYVIYQDARTYTWAVHDRWGRYSIRTRLTQAAAATIARDCEAEWRALCQRWIDAQHHDTTP